jgi:hypothetical protein
MRAAWVVIGVALVFASGCAQTDWIDRTLVTVDVTGNWYGTIKGNSAQEVWLDLKQEGGKISGSIRFRPDQSTGASGPIEGTISGDVLRYKMVRGSSYVELTISGDEMNGVMVGRPISLQRTASAPPR